MPTIWVWSIQVQNEIGFAFSVCQNLLLVHMGLYAKVINKTEFAFPQNCFALRRSKLIKGVGKVIKNKRKNKVER